ncbi:UNVERIFIED_CONTAM: hypothetical protein Sradi_1505500 [Sesamum radiatum]|uniref:Uncharacterized protein n=1 Tax=Sesamum radiatum TaxID=300843 RepID=A0AAW2U7I8_SESRA
MSSSSDESVRFMGEINPGDDPSEATSRRTDSRSAGPSSGRRRNLRQMAAAFRRLIDEEEEEVEGEASSPGEEERVVRALTPVPSFSAVDLGPSILQRAHTDQMREDFSFRALWLSMSPALRLSLPFLLPTVFPSSVPSFLQVSVFLFSLSIKK